MIKAMFTFLAACGVALGLSAMASPAMAQTTTDLITYDNDNTGNGNFVIIQEDIDNGLVFNFDADGPDESEPTIVLARHRALRAGGVDRGSVVNSGVAIRGWGNDRDTYSGGNGAIGFDGNYGFTEPPYATESGLSGQAFVNSGTGELISDQYDFNLQSGATVDISFLIGSDTDGGTATANATPRLIFDQGLGSEAIITLVAQTAVGVDATDVTTNRRDLSFTTTANYQTVRLGFNFGGAIVGKRGLIDQVSLSVTGEEFTGLTGDFNGDGFVDVTDIDFYNGNIGAAAEGVLAQLNFDGDALITVADLTFHIENYVQTSNGETGTFVGDVNLDGVVDVLNDAAALVNNLGMAATSYAQADLNGDQIVDVLGDAAALVNNLGNSNSPGGGSVATAAVPEPGCLALLGLGTITSLVARRRVLVVR